MRRQAVRIFKRWGLLASTAGLALAAAGGCGYLKAAAIALAPTTEKVAPEYKNLPGKQVLIYVWAERDILWEYSKLRLDMTGWLAAYLEKHVKDVHVVDPIQVERYVEQQRTADLDPVELGRHFKADCVIHLSVFKFSMRDPAMAHFYRGRAGASVQVYDLENSASPERVSLRDVNVVVPEKEPIGMDNTTAAAVRQATYDTFTVEVGKKFHQWERELE